VSIEKVEVIDMLGCASLKEGYLNITVQSVRFSGSTSKGGRDYGGVPQK
jgi:hypothetical protein